MYIIRYLCTVLLGVAMACAMKLSETGESVKFLLTGGVSEMMITLPRAALGEIISQVSWPKYPILGILSQVS